MDTKWWMVLMLSMGVSCGGCDDASGDAWPFDEPGAEGGVAAPQSEQPSSDAPGTPRTDEAIAGGTVVIRDRSTGELACNGYDSGSDIFGVAVVRDGAYVAWGHVVGDGIEFDGNHYGSTIPIDGTEPDIYDGCPYDFLDDTVVCLGCEGWLAVQFVDAAGRAFALRPDAGLEIVVLEYGIQCSTGSDDDRYDVLMCDDVDAARAGAFDGCVVLAAEQRGEARVALRW